METAGATDLDEVRRVVLERLAPYKVRVYLFGSRAAGTATRGSDIDVAILALEPLREGLLFEIREALEESRILSPVDLVDLGRAEPAFRQRVESEGIPWTT